MYCTVEEAKQQTVERHMVKGIVSEDASWFARFFLILTASVAQLEYDQCAD